MVAIWFMDSDPSDPKKPHKGEGTSLEYLKELGIDYVKINPDKFETELAAIQKERGYNFSDKVTISVDSFPHNYEEKIAIFFEEHLHTDDEVRYCVEGSGYFDVRDFDDKWIRIFMEKGDLITIPAGIYHRYCQDENEYIKAVRLFEGVPVWTPHNRPSDHLPIRKEYLNKMCIKS